jgi:archaellum component FlaC
VAADRLPEELIRRIREDAEFRRLLLEVLLGEEFLQLPAGLRRIEQAVDRLIEAMERDRQAAREREARIDAQIERLGQRIDDVARSIDRLADRVEAQIEALTKRMERVEAQIEALTARMERVEAQIEALTQRMERVEAQIEALTQRMERVEAQIEALTARMERVEAQIEALTQRMERVEAQIEALTARMERVEAQIEALTQRMERVEAQIEALTARMERVEDRLGSVEERLGSVEERVESLEERVGSVEDELVRVRNRLDDLTGKALEQYYRERAPAIFGRRLRRVRAMAIGQLAELITERLPGPEGDDLFEADLVVSGRLSTAEQPEVWVIIEVSATVDRFDVERAVRRATALRQLHPLVLPGVAGVRLTEGGRELASEAGVVVITDGKVTGWEAALARWLPSDETTDDALG